MSREKLTLKRVDHSTTMMKTLESLLKSNVFVDCTLAAEGQCLQAHRIILSSCSPYFQLLFTQHANKYPMIVFKDFEYKYLKMVLEFVYGGEVQVCHSQLSAFLNVAKILQIQGLDTKNREFNSEETGSQIPVSNETQQTSQILQISGEIVTHYNPIQKVDSDTLMDLGSTHPPVLSDVDSLGCTSTINIQSVCSLASDASTVPHNLVTENCSSSLVVPNLECDIKPERVEDPIEQEMDTTEPVNEQFSPAFSVKVEDIPADANVTDTENPVTDSIEQLQNTNNKYSSPNSITHAEKINSDENNATEPTTSRNHRVRRQNLQPVSECIVQAERIIVDQYFVGNSMDPSQYRKVSKFRIMYPSKDFLKRLHVKEKKNVGEFLKERRSCNAAREDSHSSTVQDIDHPMTTQDFSVSKKSAGSEGQKPKDKRPNVKEKKNVGEFTKERRPCNAAREDSHPSTVQDINHPMSTQDFSVSKKSGGSEGQKPKGDESRSSRNLNEKSDVKKSKEPNLGPCQVPRKSDKRWICDICDKRIGNKFSLVLHMRLHTGEKPYSCDICDKQFTFKSSLTCHKRSHTGEKPYKCSICNKSFAYLISLTRHKLVHSGTRPFMCKLCNKSFTQRANLVRHLGVHANLKPYECNVCQQKFSIKNNLTIHLRNHTGEKPYECSKCKKKFTQLTGLNRHLIRYGHKSENDILNN